MTPGGAGGGGGTYSAARGGGGGGCATTTAAGWRTGTGAATTQPAAGRTKPARRDIRMILEGRTLIPLALYRRVTIENIDVTGYVPPDAAIPAGIGLSPK